MAVFKYECMNKQGETIKGQMTADNLSLAVDRLRTMGLSVLDLKENRSAEAASFLSMERKVTLGELSIFSRQLAAMINAGIPVTRSLHTLSRQTDNPTFKKALESISRNVEGGMNLTDAFSAYPKIFNGLYVSMLHSGEIGGMLETSLHRLADQLQKEKALRDNVKAATFYPRIVAGFALFLFVVMLVALVPVFEGFIPKDKELPVVTKFIFSVSHSLRGFWYLWILGLVVIIGGCMMFARSSSGKYTWERIKLNLPVFGKIIHKSVIARFSRTFSTLLEGGIPVVQALESAGPTAGSLLVAQAVQNAGRRIEEGKNIAGPLEESGVFPPMVTHMIAIGEETGALPSLLDKIAEFYEDEVATLTKGLSALLEPIMLAIVGVVVGGMLISLYLPIFTAITGSNGG